MQINHIAAAVALCTYVCSSGSAAAPEAAIGKRNGDTEPKILEVIEVFGISENARVPGSMPSLKDGRIFEGKKTTVVQMEELPLLVEPNLRQMFSRTPGLFVSEQRIPSIYNVNYRGLGDPHESEFVAFFQNNVPLAANMFGYPTIYYMPAAQRVEQIEFIRGGSGLIYGPQIGPVVNFVTRGADATAENSFRSDQTTGSDGLYSTYNELNWAQGDVGILASVDHRSADGQRRNEDYEVTSGYFGVSYEGFDNIRLGFDLDLYQSDSGEAGRLTSQENADNRNLVKTPFNRVEIDQLIATVKYEQQITQDSTLDASLWYSSMDRLSRRSAMFTDPADEPETTAIDEQQFDNLGFDVRYALSWGTDHALTLGTTGYLGDSPRTRHVSDNIRSSAQSPQDLAFEQDRLMTYNALFVENLFRFGKLSVVPTLRYERVNYDLEELVKNESLERDAIDFDETFNETLFGLGLMYQTSERSELYANVSDSYRPQRFDDLINPASELAGDNGPSASRAMNYEFGYRSQPIDNLVFDISIFRIDFDDKIEQIQVNITDVERVNTGDSRHQGIEFSAEYDMLLSDAYSLKFFANGSLLDAEITTSLNPGLEGNDTAFSPDYLIRTGVLLDSRNLTASLTATLVGDQFWQDTNLSRGTGAVVIDAEIPAYEVVDLSAEYRIGRQWALHGGINNLLDSNRHDAPAHES
ncbi:MAG: TonB-dependent receptor, partial [Congregibacter sp.]|nr:TonB-dependent receptor [Congregibacter sp.]